MPSSTSSFERSVPGGAWGRAAVTAVVIAVLVTAAWEMRVRAEGYAPCRNDSSDLWARSRSRVSDDPGQVVVVGSSRILFDLDLQTCADSLGTARPIQLAMRGTNPLPLLEDLADDLEFRGTLVLGFVPSLWFAPDGSPPVARAQSVLGRYRNWSPSQRAGLVLGEALQTRLAFINADDLTLPTLIAGLQVADRAGATANLPPVLPSYLAWPDADRQNRMWEKCDFGTPLAQRTQRIWLPLFTPPPPPPHLTPEEFGAMMAEGIEARFARIAAAMDKFHRRGVKVVLVRTPSTGGVRDLEAKFTPREAFWDRVVAVSGFPGVHFEDHPELAGFECPEWSHLTANDAVLYTRALMPHLRAALAAQGG